MKARKIEFVLEILRKDTRCVCREFSLEFYDPQQIEVAISVEKLDGGAIYDLEEEEIREIGRIFRLPLVGDEVVGRIRGRQWYDDLPYRLHTNRELDLMLAGIKPLASFSGQYPPNPDVVEIPDELFAPYVNDGRFVKREFVEIGSPAGLKINRALYALENESWRIDAYILVLLTAAKTGWNESLERMEGSLLGYEEWQNDAYMKALEHR